MSDRGTVSSDMRVCGVRQVGSIIRHEGMWCQGRYVVTGAVSSDMRVCGVRQVSSIIRHVGMWCQTGEQYHQTCGYVLSGRWVVSSDMRVWVHGVRHMGT